MPYESAQNAEHFELKIIENVNFQKIKEKLDLWKCIVVIVVGFILYFYF